MDRKRPVTLVEALMSRLMDKGYDVDVPRQPIPSTNTPGVVSFGVPGEPWAHVQIKIKVFETLLDLQETLEKKIAEGIRELERDRGCQEATATQRGKTPKPSRDDPPSKPGPPS